MTIMSSNPEDKEKPRKARARLRLVEDAEERPTVGEALGASMTSIQVETSMIKVLAAAALAVVAVVA